MTDTTLTRGKRNLLAGKFVAIDEHGRVRSRTRNENATLPDGWSMKTLEHVHSGDPVMRPTTATARALDWWYSLPLDVHGL